MGETTTTPEGVRVPEDHARVLNAWLSGAGSLAQEMLLHGRASIDLAIRTDSGPSGVLVTVWIFDGAGLAVFRRPGRGYDRASADELFAALRDANVKQLVGTTPENFLDSLKRRLAREAKDIFRVSGDASTPRMVHPPVAVAARDYVAYEEDGPPKPIDMGEIAVRSSQAYWAGFTVACGIAHETFDAHHGFWEKFRFIGKSRYRKHWETCASCRSVAAFFLRNPHQLMGRILSAPDGGYTCATLEEAASVGESVLGHTESCLYCKAALQTATEQLEGLLAGADTLG